MQSVQKVKKEYAAEFLKENEFQLFNFFNR